MPCSVGPVGAQPLLSLVTSCLPGEGAGEPRKPGAGFTSDICKRALRPSVRPRPGMSIRCGRPRVRDGGGRGEQLRAPLAGPCPSSLTWTLFLCTFAPFVRKCNKSPMFLSPPSPWCPPQPDQQRSKCSWNTLWEECGLQARPCRGSQEAQSISVPLYKLYLVPVPVPWEPCRSRRPRDCPRPAAAAAGFRSPPGWCLQGGEEQGQRQGTAQG